MNFDIDDPLADILSDGSDDSFFDDDVLGKKKSYKKKVTPLMVKKTSLFNLAEHEPETEFPAKTAPVSDFGKTETNVNLQSGPKSAPSPIPFTRTISKDSIKVDDKPKTPIKQVSSLTNATLPNKQPLSTSTEILKTIGETTSKKNVKLEKGKSSQSLFDDILGDSTKQTNKHTRTSNIARSQDFGLDDILGKRKSLTTESRQQTSTTSLSTKTSRINDENENKYNTLKKTKASDDWLGIFKDSKNESENDVDMPSWLVKSESKRDTHSSSLKKEELHSKKIEQDDKEKDKNAKHEPKQSQVECPTSVNLEINQLNTPQDDVTVESAALYIQQQETQLNVALQLKAQEEKLAVMQMKQQESQRVQHQAAIAQRAHLTSMLERQSEQRQQMQALISTHQQRINERIKALLEPSKLDTEYDVTNEDENRETTLPQTRESPHRKELKQLLQLVQSLQENHDREIDLMETSYRRQLAFSDLSLNQAEERMKEESDKLVKFYTEKISWLEDHHKSYRDLTEEKLKSITERHSNELQLIEQQHLENIKALQEHHSALVNNIKDAVKQEQNLIQDTNVFSAGLQELVAEVKENKSHCMSLVNNVKILYDKMHETSEKTLDIRESHVTEILQQLKKERENFESEKGDNRESIKLLETRLKQMTQLVEDETVALKQKRMEFEFERATFNKQTEFAKNTLKKQEEEIKMIKDDIQKEYGAKLERIEEEKTKAQKDSVTAAKERASAQSLKQDLEKMKVELQSQLDEVIEERSKLNIEKQQINMEEQRVLAKSRDLDLLAKTAIDKQTQADKKYSEAEYLQRKYEERIRRLQEHVVSLNTREKQIAREKVSLSRERLSLHNEKRQLENRQQCSLCKSIQDTNEQGYIPNFSEMGVTRDARMAMNAIEDEMSVLAGHNFGLKNFLLEKVVQVEPVGGQVKSPREKFPSNQNETVDIFKDIMDPRLLQLRLDVQQVISNLEQTNPDKSDDDTK